MTRILIALLALVVLSACPNSCKKSGASESVSKDDYIKMMDAGCQKARDDAKPIVNELNNLGPDSKAIEKANSRRVYDAMIQAKAISDKLRAEQEKMSRPSQDSEDLEKFFNARKQLEEAGNAWLETLKNFADAPENQMENVATQLSERLQKRGEFARALQEAASKYGFKVCGSFVK
jgi:DNA repair exonuclease SbcCD ATPase subunit